MKKKKCQKVVIVTNIPNPYRIPLFNELNKQLKFQGIELKVIFGARNHPGRKFKLGIEECQFNYTILKPPSFRLFNLNKKIITYRGLLKILKQEKVDIIIVAGFSLCTVKIWFASFWFRASIIIWSGTTSDQKQSYFKRFYRKIIMKRAGGFIAYGSKARDYLISMGAEPAKVNIAINTVDTFFFNNKTAEFRQQLKTKGKKRHLTYIGYLIPRKNVIKLLEIMKLLTSTRDDIILDIIGDGPEKQKLERFVKQNDLSGVVQFHGFKQKNELPEFLAQSSCFLFQTGFDIWGLVLNEAMAAGLPTISSIHAGATHDLIIEGETGFVVDFADIEIAAEKINWLLDHTNKVEKIGENASKFIQEHATLEKSAQGFVRAIKEQ